MKKIPFSIENRLVSKYFNLLSPYGDVYLSGGYIRDALLGLNPFDIDFVFIGEKDVLIKKFPHIKFTNVSFEHDILFFIENRTKIDIKVFPVGTSLDEICAEKDFTFNFLFYKDNYIYSLFNAYEDALQQVILDPFAQDERYLDNPILIARFLKFYSRDRYSYHPNTFLFFKKHFKKISHCSEQKLQEIGMEVVCSNNFPSKINQILFDIGIFKEMSTPNKHTISEPFPQNSKFFYIYLAYLLNSVPLINLSIFFDIFKINKTHLDKAVEFFNTLNNFKQNHSIETTTPMTLNLLLFYFSNFEKNSPFSEIILQKNKKR